MPPPSLRAPQPSMGKKKPGLALIIGVGNDKPSPGQGQSQPPPQSGAPSPSLKPPSSPPSQPSPAPSRSPSSTPSPDQNPTPPGGSSPAPGANHPIPPEKVDYHDSTETCSGCEYFNGGQCSKLEMQVDPSGHCKLWEGKNEGLGPDTDDMGMNLASTTPSPAA